MVEEFRHSFIDRFTLSLINNHILNEDDFQAVENKGIYLTKEALKLYFEHYERRIREKFKLPLIDEEMSFRQIFKTQIHQLSQAILTKKPYNSFRIYK